MLPSPASPCPCKPYCLSILPTHPLHHTRRPSVLPIQSSSRLPLSDCSVVSSTPRTPLVDHVSFLGSDSLITTRPVVRLSTWSHPVRPHLHPGPSEFTTTALITCDPLAFPLAPNSGPDTSVVPNLRSLSDVPRMRTPCGVAPPPPFPIGSRSSLFNCFPYVFLLLWIVLHVLSLILPLPFTSFTSPWSIYSRHPLLSIGDDCSLFLFLL